MTTSVDTAIIDVTIYGSEARITRRGTVQLAAAGAQTLLLPGLPAGLDDDSVRASASSEMDLKITGVEVGFGATREHGRVEELRAEVERLEEADRELDDQIKIVEEELAQLRAMRTENTRGFVRLLLNESDGAERVDQAGRHLAELSDQARSRRRGLGAQRRVLARELDAARTALQAGDSPRTTTREITVGLDAAEAGGIELSVMYVVFGASWQSLYDIRLVDERVSLTYLASVAQSTGEDWPAVPLTLSTARPGTTQELPDPDPWYVDVDRAPMLRAGTSRGAMAFTTAAPAAEFDQGLGSARRQAAVPEDAIVDDSGIARAYQAARPVAIPSDGAPRRVHLAQLDLDAEVDHVCAPRTSTEVHVRAKVRNGSALTLLPGQAAVFHAEEFVGRTALELVAPNEEIELHLGVQDAIKVEHELKRRDAKKSGLIGHSGRIRMVFETSVTNHLSAPARLLLIEQLPVSRDPAITVKLAEAKPPPTRTEELGKLEWDLALNPGQESIVGLDYSVEAPRDKKVVGLDV